MTKVSDFYPSRKPKPGGISATLAAAKAHTTQTLEEELAAMRSGRPDALAELAARRAAEAAQRLPRPRSDGPLAAPPSPPSSGQPLYYLKD